MTAKSVAKAAAVTPMSNSPRISNRLRIEFLLKTQFIERTAPLMPPVAEVNIPCLRLDSRVRHAMSSKLPVRKASLGFFNCRRLSSQWDAILGLGD
jgi:hypothetical protein